MNIKLIETLKTFKKGELERFGTFVNSPYFNQRKEVKHLFDYLSTFLSKSKHEELDIKELIHHSKVNPTGEKKQFAYTSNYLQQLVDSFLAIQSLESDPDLKDLLAMQGHLERRQEKQFRFLTKRVDRNLSKGPQITENHLFKRFYWSSLQHQHFSQEKKRTFDKSLQQALKDLDYFYFLKRLKYSCEALNTRSIIQGPDLVDLQITDQIAAYLEQMELNYSPLIKLYLAVFKMLRSAEPDQPFQHLGSLIDGLEGEIAVMDLRDIYIYAINFCARKIRKGKKEYISYALELYQKGIDNKALFEGNHLSPWTYTNVVKLSLNVERYAWAEAFIYGYVDRLEPRYQKNALYFNLADLYYQQQEYGHVLECLNKVELDDINYLLGVRLLYIKTFYDSDEIEPMLSNLSSFSVYLRRNKRLGANLLETHLNFCRILQAIMRRKEKDRERLYHQIREAGLLTDRRWLLKVLEKEMGLPSTK